MGRRSPIVLLTLAFAALLLTPAPEAAAEDQDVALAERYFKLGRELYRRADYAEALKLFEKSYGHSKKPGLLFNIGRCKESLGDHAGAIALYERYRASNPPDAALIETRIANLRRLVEKRRPTPASRPASPAPPPPPAASPATPPVAANPVAKEQPGRPLRTAGWIAVASGGALLATGLVLGGLASSAATDLEQGYRDGTLSQQDATSDEDRGKALELGQIVTLIAGGVAAGAGAVLLYLDHRRQAGGERAAWIAPAVTSRGAYVVTGFRFR